MIWFTNKLVCVCARARERVVFFPRDNTKNIVWRQVHVNGTHIHKPMTKACYYK